MTFDPVRVPPGVRLTCPTCGATMPGGQVVWRDPDGVLTCCIVCGQRERKRRCGEPR